MIFINQYLDNLSNIIQEEIHKNISSLLFEFNQLKTDKHKNIKVADISIHDILSRGCRGVPTLFTNVSGVNQQFGQYIRNISLEELQHRDPVEIFFLSMTGNRLYKKSELLEELFKIEIIDKNTQNFINSLVANNINDPMHCLSMIMLFMSGSAYYKKSYSYDEKKKLLHVDHAILDALKIYAILPNIISILYSKLNHIHISSESWISGYSKKICSCLNISHNFQEIIQKYIIAHSGQGKGNVAAHVSHLTYCVNNNVYECLSNSITALGGKKHARSSYDSIKMIDYFKKEYGSNPTDNIKDGIKTWLNQYGYIPGFGQAIMKNKDPRFNILYNAGKDLIHDSNNHMLISSLIKNVPEVLKERGINISNSSPNVNFISGIILREMGIKDYSFYPVMFFLGRVTDLLSQYIENIIFEMPVERPSSLTSYELLQKSFL